MKRGILFLPFAAVVALAGYLGWKVGQPLSEADVLEFYAGKWVIEGPEGAQKTDCHGVPGDVPDVWMVIVCTKDVYKRRTRVTRDGSVYVAPKEPQA